MARILKHAHSEELEAEHLVTDDGKPNLERIKEYIFLLPSLLISYRFI